MHILERWVILIYLIGLLQCLVNRISYENSAIFMNPSIHIGEEIRQQLKAQERSIAWLAGKVNHDSSNLCKLLKCSHIPTELLYHISVALSKDFFAQYSQQLSKEFASW